MGNKHSDDYKKGYQAAIERAIELTKMADIGNPFAEKWLLKALEDRIPAEDDD